MASSAAWMNEIKQERRTHRERERERGGEYHLEQTKLNEAGDKTGGWQKGRGRTEAVQVSDAAISQDVSWRGSTAESGALA